MAIQGVLANIMNAYRKDPGLARSGDDGHVERPGEGIGEQRKDVYSHRSDLGCRATPGPSCSRDPVSKSEIWSRRGSSTSMPSLTALVLPGRLTIRVVPRVTAIPRDRAANGV
jgi:hypothetical protein